DWAGFNGVGILWRYDGTQWFPISWGFVGEFVSLQSIAGFGPSNIYAIGKKENNAFVLHFDGNVWRGQTLTENGIPGTTLLSIRGDSPSNIWTGGIYNSVYHFDGSQWNKIHVNEKLWFKDFAISNGKTYALAYTVDQQPFDTTRWYFLGWNNAQWDTISTFVEVIGQGPDELFGKNSLTAIGNEVYSADPGVFKRIADSWIKVFADRDVAKVFGATTDNIFGVGTYGRFIIITAQIGTSLHNLNSINMIFGLAGLTGERCSLSDTISTSL
ncbi:MAG: hypothetical protein ACRDGA_03845, partial [Bacteroidota bacterium]